LARRAGNNWRVWGDICEAAAPTTAGAIVRTGKPTFAAIVRIVGNWSFASIERIVVAIGEARIAKERTAVTRTIVFVATWAALD
jgi:hypothetical protein